ncbi:MAG: hypothetical protein ACOC16_01245 [Nanoarchaeota archaeon]
MNQKFKLEQSQIFFHYKTSKFSGYTNVKLLNHNPNYKNQYLQLYHLASKMLHFAVDNNLIYMGNNKNTLKSQKNIKNKVKIPFYEVKFLNINNLNLKLESRVCLLNNQINIFTNFKQNVYCLEDFQKTKNIFEKFNNDCFKIDLEKNNNYNLKKYYVEFFTTKHFENKENYVKTLINKYSK